MNIDTSNGIVVPIERVETVNRGGRPSKVDLVIRSLGVNMVDDLAARRGSIRSAARRVADWSKANGLKMSDATGRRVIRKLITSGRLTATIEDRRGVSWKIVSAPSSQAFGPLK